MIAEFDRIVLESTGAQSAQKVESIQSLWSGYGEIARMQLQDAAVDTVVVKNVVLPANADHPRGWNTDLGHQRKVQSYEVEMAWYRDYASKCIVHCRIPKCYASHSIGNEHLIVLEDLDAAGFALRKSSPNTAEIYACLDWLANFHATFLNTSPEQLWEVGTYWHLATRPEELAMMDNFELQLAAPIIDETLNNCKYKTLVHGDAKVANFCFSATETKVAAVDFQYVGGGCGMKDVAYFIGSVLHEDQCEARESELLDFYFAALQNAIEKNHPTINFTELEAEWRYLFPIAWTDFHRFLLGWSPGHWKINAYSSRLAAEVIGMLG